MEQQSMRDASGNGKRSWRTTPQSGLVKPSRYLWRFILSGLAIALIAMAIYIAIPRPPVRTFLLVLSDDREERNILPPVPYITGDSAALQSWTQSARMPSLVLQLSKVESAASLARQLSPESTGSRLNFSTAASGEVPLAQKDTLVVYIKGHGLVIDDTGEGTAGRDKVGSAPASLRPVIVKSLSENDLAGAWYRDSTLLLDVRQLLQGFAELPAVQTLVIFDCLHVNYDPRLGMLVNAFPSAVKQAVEKLPTRENLWVLVGQGDGELAVGVPGAGRSAFVDSLVSGLERQKGEGLGLAATELFQRVQTSLNNRNQNGRGSFRQTIERLFPPTKGGLANTLNLPNFLPPPTENATAPTAGGEAAKAVLNAPPVQAVTAPAERAAADIAIISKAASDAAGALAPAAASKDGSPSSTAGAAVTPKPGSSANPSAISTLPAPGAPLGDLELAFQTRDRLRDNFRSTWSPAQIGPQYWRRVEGLLTGFDEQRLTGDRLTGELGQRDNQTLRLLSDDLRKLEGIFAGRDGTCTTDDCRGLAESFAAFKRSPAFRSFEPRSPSGLEAANEALRVFTETAYRARDYIALQGQTAAVLDGGPFVNDASLEALLDKLQALRMRLDPAGLTESRLNESRSRDLTRLSREVDAARDQVESEIESYAHSLAVTPDSPGKLLRVHLLLHSPAVSAALRDALRKPVPPSESPPEPAAVPAAPALGERLAANARLTRKLFAVIAPTSQSSSSKAVAIAIAPYVKLLESATAQTDALAWLSIGRAARDYSAALPAAVRSDATARGSRFEPTALDAWDFHRAALLVDGRDVRRWPDRALLTSWISQPIRPELIPDKVEIAVVSTPIQLRSPDQEPTAVSVGVRIQSEQPSPFPVTLELHWNPTDIEVTRGDGGPPIRNNRLELQVENNATELPLRIKPRRTTADGMASSVRVQASFNSARSATTDLRCLLPRPDQIELTLAADSNLQAARNRTWAPSTPQGGRLNLFPNRERVVGLYLTNLSSEHKKLNAKLYRIPAAAASAGGRLFDAKSGLSLMPASAAFETRLSQPNADIAQLLRGLLIAQTNEKEPVSLPANGASSARLALTAVAPPPTATPAANPPPIGEDVTGGLLLVVQSAEGKGNPYFKWIELQMLQPDDLLAIKEPRYREGELSFRVELKDTKLIDEMGLAKESLKLAWEGQSLPREVREPTKLAEILASDTQGAIFSAKVSAAVPWPLTVQLHVDRDPRGLVALLDRRGDSITLTNWKENRPPSLHIWRAGATANRLNAPAERIAYLRRPLQQFLAYPAAAALTEGLTERPLTMPIFVRVDPRDAIAGLDASLGTDAAPKYFADGARLRLTADGQTKEFATERQVSVRGSIIEGGLLQVQCEAGDFTRIEFGPIDVPQDKRIELTADVEGDRLRASSAEYAHDSVAYILDRTPPIVSELSIRKLNPPAAPPAGLQIETTVRVRCRADDGAGSGINKVEMVLGFDMNRNTRLDEAERRPKITATRQSDGYYSTDITLKGEMPSDLLLAEAIATDNVQYASIPGEASLPLPKQAIGGERPTFGKGIGAAAKALDKLAPPKKSP
jgi:hypothetical protein